MSAATIVAIVTAVLSLISQMLPMLGTDNSKAISGIIKTLTSLLPLIVDQVGVTYIAVKNIINALGTHPAATADQLTDLAALDKTVDEAWNAIESQIDPDAAPATT